MPNRCAAPSTIWYLAEGSTNGFDLFYLLQNPNDAAATVRVRFLRGQGAPTTNGGRGDEYVEVYLVAPKRLSKRHSFFLASTQVAGFFI